MHCGGVTYRIKNAQSKIVGPRLSFNFHLLETRFFKNCGAHFICSEGCLPQRFGTYAETL